MRHWQETLGRNTLPTLKKVGKFALISALTYAPAGLAGWAVKSVARRPLKIMLAWALEPLIRRAMRGATTRWYKR
ncbi:phage shock protein PspD [Erwinia endophytica]|uniref:phage shock protein PspD n=1 Tax=Erwinia endophytica TaxID=1563158 RepID=UPI001265EF1B|nr:phage shock protein PspD [Erwinia endophytica]KAB8313644.1 phage shock protein PspD [Erwinia endophytica]